MNHYYTIKKAIEHLVAAHKHPVSFNELAKALHLSPGHLRTVFMDWAGISPKQFERYLTLEYAKTLLAEHKNSQQTTHLAGLSSGGRLHDLFIDIEAVTPGEYQTEGKNLTIYYSTFGTRFGQCLVASTEKGVCNILFFDQLADGIADLRSRWPKAGLLNRRQQAHTVIQNYFAGLQPTTKIKVYLHGTNFQIKVWEALLSIPEGAVTSYGEIAKHLGDRGLAQAVGGAVGENPIGYLIPCHRVLKSTGEISGYHWGIDRKRAMLLYEAAKKEVHTDHQLDTASDRKNPETR